MGFTFIANSNQAVVGCLGQCVEKDSGATSELSSEECCGWLLMSAVSMVKLGMVVCLAPPNLLLQIEKLRSPDPQSPLLRTHSHLQKHSYMKEEPWAFKFWTKEISKEREDQRQRNAHRKKLRVKHRARFGCGRGIITEGQSKHSKKDFFLFLKKEKSATHAQSRNRTNSNCKITPGQPTTISINISQDQQPRQIGEGGE